ncbi:MAG: type II toxin-antitoxin system HicB family antitoxin [Chloroflexota bacterium]|nr:type II toxin-antitoxin system HicB family antitoxin [Chloroflexota bacterium]
MKRQFSASVWQEGDWYIAQALEVDVASQGHSEQEALANLQDALQLHFAPPSPAPLPQIHHIEVEIGAT